MPALQRLSQPQQRRDHTQAVLPTHGDDRVGDAVRRVGWMRQSFAAQKHPLCAGIHRLRTLRRDMSAFRTLRTAACLGMGRGRRRAATLLFHGRINLAVAADAQLPLHVLQLLQLIPQRILLSDLAGVSARCASRSACLAPRARCRRLQLLLAQLLVLGIKAELGGGHRAAKLADDDSRREHAWGAPC